MGFFYTFVYKDFLAREIVQNVKWWKLKNRKFDLDDELVQLDLHYDEFMATSFTQWMDLCLSGVSSNNFFQPYSRSVSPHLPKISKLDEKVEEVGQKLLECCSYQWLLQRHLKPLFQYVPVVQNFAKNNTARYDKVFSLSLDYEKIVNTHLQCIKENKLVATHLREMADLQVLPSPSKKQKRKDGQIKFVAEQDAFQFFKDPQPDEEATVYQSPGKPEGFKSEKSIGSVTKSKLFDIFNVEGFDSGNERLDLKDSVLSDFKKIVPIIGGLRDSVA